MNVKHDMMVSEMLETPAGVNSVFSCAPCEGGFRWERDYDKTGNDPGWGECIETHSQYLKSMAYEVFALSEIVNIVPVNYNHWTFLFN